MTHLFGVTHGFSLESLVGEVPFDVRPSIRLIERLRELPRGSRVAIELPSEWVDSESSVVESIVVDGETIPLSHGPQYWSAITHFISAFGHHADYIDDARLFNDGMRAQSSLRDKCAEMDALDKRRYSTKRASKKRDTIGLRLRHEAYALDMKAEHLLVIERERRMLQRVLASPPDALIMGIGHADYLWSQRSALAAQGLSFDSYCVETPDENEAFLHMEYDSSDHPLSLRNKFREHPGEPSQQSLAEHECIIRRHTVANKGRVLPGRRPDFVGTWNTFVPVFGLFEVYVEQKKNNSFYFGTIEDTFGSARFQGLFFDDTVSFGKKYTDFSGRGALHANLAYEARLNRGVFRGQFSAPGVLGGFWMVPFEKYDPAMLLQRELSLK